MGFKDIMNELENTDYTDDYIIKVGEIPILFTAPHTMQQVKENGEITRKEVEEMFGIKTTKAYRVLNEMCAENLLEQKGEGKLRRYEIKH